MTRRGVVWALIAAAVAFVLSLRYSGGLLPTEPPRTVHVVNLVSQPQCEPLGRTCRALAEGLTLGLQLPSEVPTMRGFPVLVEVAGEANAEIEAVLVEFTMEGMDMGVNRFRLARQQPGLWSGSVTLPVCTTGRRDWLAAVDADVGERRYRAQFQFRSQ